MTDNPLTHEPCYENTHISSTKNKQYAEYIEHQIIQLFFKNMESNYYEKYMNEPDFKEIILKNYELLKEKVAKKALGVEILYTVLPYSMSGSTSWKKLNNHLQKI
jgi:hypothetical protein